MSVRYSCFLCAMAIVSGCCLFSPPAAAQSRIEGRLLDSWGHGAHEVWMWTQTSGSNALNQQGAAFAWLGDYAVENLTGGTYNMVATEYGIRRPLLLDGIVLPAGGTAQHALQYSNTFDLGRAGQMSLGTATQVGQTFVANGTRLRKILFPVAGPEKDITLSIHVGGPNGQRLGQPITNRSGQSFQVRYEWQPEAIVLIPGKTYYVKAYHPFGEPFFPLVAASTGRYPNGHAWLDDVPYPNLDLFIDITCRDDDLIFEMEFRGDWRPDRFTSVGQTFRARGRELRLAGFMLAETGVTRQMRARLFQSPGGAQIGPTKTATAQANVRVYFVWGPGEAPLTPGQQYYVEMTQVNGADFPVYGDRGGYLDGQAYFNGVPSDIDLSLDLVSLQPLHPEIDIQNQLLAQTFPRGARVTWTTNVACTSHVELWQSGQINPNRRLAGYTDGATTNHDALIEGLQPGVTYQYRVVCWAANHTLTHGPTGSFTTPVRNGLLAGRVTASGQPVAQAEIVALPSGQRARTDAQGHYQLTLSEGEHDLRAMAYRADSVELEGVSIAMNETTTWDVALVLRANLLQNGGFENGQTGWTSYGQLDGVHLSGHAGVIAHGGERWAGSNASFGAKTGGLRQRLAVAPNRACDVAAWLYSDASISGQRFGGYAQVRLGVDPAGGNDPSAAGIEWTRWTFTDGQWERVAMQVMPQGEHVTVFLETRHESWWEMPHQFIAGFDDVSVSQTSDASMSVY